MLEAVPGQLDLVLAGNDGETDQGGVDLFETQDAAGPGPLKILKGYNLVLGSFFAEGLRRWMVSGLLSAPFLMAVMIR